MTINQGLSALHPVILEWGKRLDVAFDLLELDGSNLQEVKNGIAGHPIKFEAPGVFSVPLLSDWGCRLFLGYAEQYRDQYTVNDKEIPDARIPELVLKHFLPLGAGLADAVAKAGLLPVFKWIMGHAPDIVHAQLCRYTPEGTKETCFHNDRDSGYTAVVNLSNNGYRGGGTIVLPNGPIGTPVNIPPLPAGHALIFNGRATLHRGAPVLWGERNLLVYWCRQENYNE